MRTLCLLGLLGVGLLSAAEPPKPVQGEVTRPPKPVKPKDTQRAALTDGASEVLAVSFGVEGEQCITFDSELDLYNSPAVAISILALRDDLRTTRIIPLFAVRGALFYAAGASILRGSEFPFSDAGGGVVPVLGPYLLVRVCNDGTQRVNYTQLTTFALPSAVTLPQ